MLLKCPRAVPHCFTVIVHLHHVKLASPAAFHELWKDPSLSFANVSSCLQQRSLAPRCSQVRSAQLGAVATLQTGVLCLLRTASVAFSLWHLCGPCAQDVGETLRQRSASSSVRSSQFALGSQCSVPITLRIQHFCPAFLMPCRLRTVARIGDIQEGAGPWMPTMISVQQPLCWQLQNRSCFL